MRRRPLRWLAVLTAAGLVLGGCAGDDDDEAGQDTGTDTEGEATGGDEEFQAVEAVTAPDCEYGGTFRSIEAVDRLTVRFELCAPDVAFPAKVAFSAFGIHPSEYLEETGGGGELVESPIGTGPYRIEAWQRGNQLVLSRFDDYWGEPAAHETVVFRWSAEAAQRLVELRSGAVHGIDNVGPDDFAGVEGDPNLQLIERDPLNVFYLGFNRDMEPFDDERVRQALALAIDKDRIVQNFYPPGSQAADQFLPPGIPGYVEEFEEEPPDLDAARQLLADAGYPDGFEIDLSLRDVVRGYLPQPTQVAQDIQAQLAQIGVRVNVDVQESGTFIDNVNAGNLPFYMLGWGADYPDPTNFLDFHFGAGAPPQFGAGFPDIHEVLDEAASTTDEEQRADLYEEAARLIREHDPMIPVAYGGSAVAWVADADGAHASPLSNESMAAVEVPGQDQLVWMQNAEPIGLYCADETDGESLRACEQINESLLAYEVGGVETQPGLAEEYESNDELTEWTFHLRDGVEFHDGSMLDANDVVMSYLVQWDAEHPLHVGRVGDFTYFQALFGAFLNAPPSEG